MREGTTVLAVAVMIGSLTMLARQAISQGKEGARENVPSSPGQMQEMMAKWTKVARPGPHHKHLDPFVGKWNIVTKMWWGGSGAPASETRGKAEVEWIFDGRFVMEEMTGEIMMPGPEGQMRPVPYKGLGLTGYDNFKNMYVSLWCDNQNTAMHTLTGMRDPSGRFTYYGQMDEPMMDVYGKTVKTVMRIVDEDTRVFEMYDLHAGDAYKVMEITYTRSE